MVKSNVDKLSQPSAVWNINVAVLLDDVYVTPSIQVYISQCTCTSVLDAE